MGTLLSFEVYRAMKDLAELRRFYAELEKEHALRHFEEEQELAHKIIQFPVERTRS